MNIKLTPSTRRGFTPTTPPEPNVLDSFFFSPPARPGAGGGCTSAVQRLALKASRVLMSNRPAQPQGRRYANLTSFLTR